MTKEMLSLMLALACTAMSLPATAEERTIPVTTAPLHSVAFHRQYSAPATTLSLNQSRISAQTSGVIQSIPVRVGDTVAQGALLTQLDCRDYDLRLTQAEAGLSSIEARLNLASRQIERTHSLLKSNSASEERLNQQQAELQVARAERRAQQAAIREAQLNQQRCRITAPFEGVVEARLASEGEWVTPGQPLIRLTDQKRLEISAQVSVDLIETLRESRSIRLRTNRGEFPLEIRRISPLVDPKGRNREVRLLFTEQHALPGSSGRLQWQSPRPYLPADLPVRRGESLGLFLLASDRVRFHPLPDAEEGQPARVELAPDTRLVIEGRQSLQEGDQVTEGQ